ncbi:MAG: S-adenosylmethionine:tRNA ribosyltransferase-isomerase [Bacteroidales bacterium]|nr:S-adenosylmethionine:tRNA ribosyltransferase-isomerase [Bacteroidales bacterium]
MKHDPKNIKIKDYMYELPEERIARYPLARRDSSRLLVYRSGTIGHDVFSNIGRYLKRGDIMVYNQTRVIRARLMFRKQSGAAIEIFCLEPKEPALYEKNFAARNKVSWHCLVGNRKKWKGEKLEMALSGERTKTLLWAEELERNSKDSVIRFSWDNKQLCFSEILNMAGHVPLPPYLNREDEDIDSTRYQTVYSRDYGSVAAPTAGLHFTDNVLSELRDKGIKEETVTLHVGAGTFVPVKTETIGGHNMHREHFRVDRSMIENIICGKRIIAVGTTSLRTLESLYWIGHMISSGKIDPGQNIYLEQWYPYENETSAGYQEYLKVILDYLDKNKLDQLEAQTGIIIVPGYKMRIARGLVTNYHMPGSTLLLLVAALTGDSWRDIYKYSLDNGFRFLSYGDSSLLLP